MVILIAIIINVIIAIAIAIVVLGDIPRVIEFMMYNPSALWYNVLTAITSTTGQIAIFYTIKRFGPVVFTIIMTTRQMMSIVLSTVLFGHKISAGNVPFQIFPVQHHPPPNIRFVGSLTLILVLTPSSPNYPYLIYP